MHAGHNIGAISGCFTQSVEMAIGRKEASNYIVDKQKLAQISLNDYNQQEKALLQNNIRNCAVLFVILKREKSSKQGVKHRY
jgi:hypothetical protein